MRPTAVWRRRRRIIVSYNLLCHSTILPKFVFIQSQHHNRMSYTQSLYHVVFSTYGRRPVIDNDNRHHLYAVIASEIKKRNCRALIINGVQDHIHILLSLSSDVALSSLIRDVKSKSSVWAKASGLFPLFNGWEREYAAFSLSYSHRAAVYDYIAAQQQHHTTTKLDSEYHRLVLKAGLKFYHSKPSTDVFDAE